MEAQVEIPLLLGLLTSFWQKVVQVELEIVEMYQAEQQVEVLLTHAEI